ncbi:MAG TPA: hypothetical protein DGQ94_18770 [Pseudomonas sp.]|nr:hypothetical protein [Pseudomonas sp.]
MKGTARPPTPRPLHPLAFSKRSAQARQGRRRQGAKPDGRGSAQGTGRGAQPANPTAGLRGFQPSLSICKRH